MAVHPPFYARAPCSVSSASAPSLRCCGPLCAPGSTAKKSTSAPRYRQAFQAHLCDRCILQWNKAKAVLCIHAAVAQVRQRPLAPVLQTIVGSIPRACLAKPSLLPFRRLSAPLFRNYWATWWFWRHATAFSMIPQLCCCSVGSHPLATQSQHIVVPRLVTRTPI